MSQTSPDAKAVVRAAEALTTQVRRIADALSTPVVRVGDGTPTTLVACNQPGPWGDAHACIRPLGHPDDHEGHDGCGWRGKSATDDTPTTPDDDALRRMLTDALTAEHYRRAREQIVASPEEHSAGMAAVALQVVTACRAAEATTPATTCSAQYHGPDNPWVECIRPAHHPGVHINERGFHWSEDVAVYPLVDSTVKVGPPIPRPSEEIEDERAVREHRVAAEDAACRLMETRTCPPSYNGPCGDRPCARFESDDPRPWLVQGTRDLSIPEQRTAADEPPSWERHRSLAVLLSRAQRGVTPLTSDEAALLRRHVEAEIREAKTAREVARGNLRHAREIVPELAAAQAAIERVRAVPGNPLGGRRQPSGPEQESYVRGWSFAINAVAEALDGTEQPTTEGH